MLRKLSLLAASLTAALVVAGGLALAGFGPGTAGDQPQLVNDAAPATTADAAPPEAPVQVDTVYLTPQATPETVTITRVKTTSARHHGDDEGEHEGGDDD